MRWPCLAARLRLFPSPLPLLHPLPSTSPMSVYLCTFTVASALFLIFICFISSYPLVYHFGDAVAVTVSSTSKISNWPPGLLFVWSSSTSPCSIPHTLLSISPVLQPPPALLFPSFFCPTPAFKPCFHGSARLPRSARASKRGQRTPGPIDVEIPSLCHPRSHHITLQVLYFFRYTQHTAHGPQGRN